MVEEVSGVMRGALTLVGSSPAVSASCSASIWRARNTSVPSLNTAVMMDRPSMDSERSDSMSPRPLTVDSIGSVTSSSTCSGASPGHSVWITTCGWTKFGKTSSLALLATWMP